MFEKIMILNKNIEQKMEVSILKLTLRKVLHICAQGQRISPIDAFVDILQLLYETLTSQMP